MASQKYEVLNISGGKDSTAMYLLAFRELGVAATPVFADTGNEHPITVEYVNTLAERTGGPTVRTVQADFTASSRHGGARCARSGLRWVCHRLWLIVPSKHCSPLAYPS